MRLILSSLLVLLLALCPALCLGDGGVCEQVRCGGQDTDTAPCPDEAPQDRCPEDGRTCICAGAVQASDAKPPAPDQLPSDPLPRPALGSHGGAIFLIAHHLTADGRPAGLASWGDALTVRARLQNFRL